MLVNPTKYCLSSAVILLKKMVFVCTVYNITIAIAITSSKVFTAMNGWKKQLYALLMHGQLFYLCTKPVTSGSEHPLVRHCRTGLCTAAS